MEAQFTDRILSCSDCHGDFIFTAGEQLFFHDKQFKNDPKRCKPCKSRRSGLAAIANGTGPAASGLSRTETRTECSECQVETTVPFKPTQGRPVLCRQCFQAKNRVAAAMQELAAAAAASATEETISALTYASADINGSTMSTDEALMAASSMASASRQSSVSSAADLAWVAGLDGHLSSADIPRELLAAANLEAGPAELVGATVALTES